LNIFCTVLKQKIPRLRDFLLLKFDSLNVSCRITL
jgi:hypothetical protein